MSRKNLIKISRGLKSNLPDASLETLGELKFTKDTKELFIDNGTENVSLGKELINGMTQETIDSLAIKIPNSFETFSSNLRSYPVIDTEFIEGVSLSKTYSTPNGNIVVTTNFVDGKPSTKVLSGVGLPSGIATTKTYNFTGRTIPLVSYT